MAVLNPDMSGLTVRDLAGQALASGSHHGRRIILLVVLVVIVVIVAVVIAHLVRSRRNRTGTPTGRRGGDQ